MRISSSTVGMDSVRSYTSVEQRKFSFMLKTGSLKSGIQLGVGNNQGNSGEDKNSFSNALNTSGEENSEKSSVSSTLNQLMKSDFRTRGSRVSSVRNSSQQKSIEKIRQQCMQYLIYCLFPSSKGKSISFSEWSHEVEAASSKYSSNMGNSQNMSESDILQALTQDNSSSGFTTMQANTSMYSYQQETTSFSTTGTVRTADGREINFNLEMTMSRQFEQYYEMNNTQTIFQAVDPLVINLDGSIAEVSDQKFEFDIDGDGILDNISKLNSGSGYLAIDKNGDGIINDGTELFGTQSGDGFYDLSKYDSDGNGWIDEGDEIWEKLLIWTQGENGEDQLYHVSKAGVGAICLQRVSTDFSLNSLNNNQTNAQIRSTGVFLYEDGNVGSVQHLDLMR